jgi:S-adenosylmethionine hydrolase
LIKNLGIITLTTDWGDKDYYAGAVKGSVYQLLPGVVVVDISHNIRPFDIAHAAYVLKNSFETFPKGTVHIIGVDTEDFVAYENVQSHIVVSYKGHYFIGADNGIFSMITGDGAVDKIIELTTPFDAYQDKVRFTFSCRDRFVKAAVHLAGGGDPGELGKQLESFKESRAFEPSYGNDFIKGIVIHIDHFENAVTNITEELFEKVADGRSVTLTFKRTNIKKISKLYSDVKEIEPLALFNGAGMLEIALNRSNASGLLGLRKNDSVLIEFTE